MSDSIARINIGRPDKNEDKLEALKKCLSVPEDMMPHIIDGADVLLTSDQLMLFLATLEKAGISMSLKSLKYSRVEKTVTYFSILYLNCSLAPKHRVLYHAAISVASINMLSSGDQSILERILHVTTGMDKDQAHQAIQEGATLTLSAYQFSELVRELMSNLYMTSVLNNMIVAKETFDSSKGQVVDLTRAHGGAGAGAGG
jgi:hypothetical protein